MLSLAGNAFAQPVDSNALARAAELMKGRQYNDAIKVLTADLKGKADADAVKPNLMLGECHYLLKEYEPARASFSKAARAAGDPADKLVADYRLACVAYRLGEKNSAAERIDAFAAAYPGDSRLGVLLTFKMRLAIDKGKAGETEIVALRERVVANSRQYGTAAAMEADEILCDFYKSVGQEEKAVGLYQRIVTTHRRMIADLEKDRQPVPPGLERTHDNAALQLGAIFLNKRQHGEATKWLENVRYDAELRARARLLLARGAYEVGDHAACVAHLTDRNFLASVPEGPLKSDVYLMLGMAEKTRANGNAGKAEEWLKQVDSKARGYAQAQGTLGDLYRDKGLHEQAVRAYAAAIASPDHAPAALLGSGSIYVERGEREPDTAKSAELTKRGAELLAQLVQQYPLTPQAKEARAKVTALAQKGIDVGAAAGAEEMLRGWERVARERPGTSEAAQALAQIVRVHAKAAVDEKTKKVTRGPNYSGVGAAADPLLDAKVYKGAGMTEASWRGLRCEMLYQRALAELASLNPSRELEAVGATYVKAPSAGRAVAWLKEAQQAVDPKQLELVKGIELALLEAMFKSDDKASQEQAERRMAELEADYGNDARFARLTLELAGFYQAKGRLVEAAAQYAGAARRGRDLAADDAVKLWYAAGTLYSRAAYDAQQKGAQRDYGVLLSPRESAVSLGDAIDPAVRGDPRFTREVEIRWPRGGQGVTPREALVAISTASEIAFVSPTAKGRETIAAYLDERRLTLKDGRYTAEAALALVLDFKLHRVAPDIGLADSPPTIQRPKASGDEPAAGAIEIYDARQEAARLAALGRQYGAWRAIHQTAGAGKSRTETGVLLYDVLARIEILAGVHIAWADTVDKQAKLGVELRERDVTAAGLNAGADAPCAAVLSAALAKADLRFRVVSRDLAARYYELGNRAFNEARKIDPTGRTAEKALFAVAINFYNQRDYARMKQVLRTYLKLFDNPENETHQQACFWVGYALEQEKKFREAVNFYARAAEERLVIVNADPADAGAAIDPAALKKRLSYESQFALSEPLAGELKDLTLGQFADFVQVNTHVSVRVDAKVTAGAIKVDKPAFKGVSGLDLLAEALKPHGLACRVENVNPEYAEKAYFRLAAAYKRDGLLEQALENCSLLLARYPKSERRREATRLVLDIYRGQGDLARAVATLEELRKTASDADERRRLDLEMAGLLFDQADYDAAAGAYQKALAGAKDVAERQAARDGYARALARLGRHEAALAEYEALVKDGSPLSTFIDSMMAFHLRYVVGKAKEIEFPEEGLRYMAAYENLSDLQRQRMSAEQLAKAMAIYYVKGMIDLDKGRFDEGVQRLEFARHSPDDLLAGEAGIQAALAYAKKGDDAGAKAALQALLLQTRSNEARVRGTYLLGVCHARLGENAEAARRFAEVIDKFPGSPLAKRAMGEEAYRASRGK
ncbi:MAG TPA: tetratricopeptide repeat protein [Tepidisphaeraceae bacterium]|nr:tetratricopeptide repeat protein [Tepidisphaeraceae bacterium]